MTKAVFWEGLEKHQILRPLNVRRQQLYGIPENAAWPWRYGFALFLASASIFFRLELDPLLGRDSPVLFSIIAVAIAAWVAGFGPGVFATLVSFVGAVAILLTSPGGEDLVSAAQILRLLLFLLTGLIISGLTEALYQTDSAWHRAESEHENRILQERNRMAREIHDTLAQGLTGIIIQLEAADDSLDESPETAIAHIKRAQDLARHSLTEARRSVQALRPQFLEERNLPEALRRYAEQMTTGLDVRVLVNVQGIARNDLPQEVDSNLLRIGVEALSNALKHSRATTVNVELVYERNTVSLSVKDNGRGFLPHAPQNKTGFGLTGMWERAERIGAQFTLASHRGEGTEVRVVVAVPATGLGRA